MLDAGRNVDILINNAAIMACPETRVGPGWEAQFATNHLGHFAFTNVLWPLLVAGGGARVVALSSTGHKLSPIRFDDLQWERVREVAGLRPGQDRQQPVRRPARRARPGRGRPRLRGAPGRDHDPAPASPLARGDDRLRLDGRGRNVDDRFKTTEQGASTSTWAATSPALAGMGGVYCENCDIALPTDVGSPSARIEGVDAHAIDRDDAARLSGRSRRS